MSHPCKIRDDSCFWLLIAEKLQANDVQQRKPTNPFQLLYDKICSLERKVDELTKQKGITKQELPEDNLMTVDTAAKYLRMSRSSIYQLTSRHELPFMKKGMPPLF